MRGQGGPGKGHRAPPANGGVGVPTSLRGGHSEMPGTLRVCPYLRPKLALGICSSWCMRSDPQTKYLVSRVDGLEMQILLLCFQQTVTFGLLEP